MAVFIVLWPYLLTTKLRCLQKNNIGHTSDGVTLYRDYWPFSKSIKNVQFRFQIALLAVLFTAPFLKFMTSNSGLCSEAKGSEKKPKLARIAVGKVIV